MNEVDSREAVEEESGTLQEGVHVAASHAH